MMFTLTQCLFCLPLIIDVREQTVPSDNAPSIVPQRLPPGVDPPVDAIEAPYAMIKVHRLSERVAPQPLVLQQLLVFRVNGCHRPLPESLSRCVQIVESAFVEVFAFTF